jgi:hypothetical protein
MTGRTEWDGGEEKGHNEKRRTTRKSAGVKKKGPRCVGGKAVAENRGEENGKRGGNGTLKGRGWR